MREKDFKVRQTNRGQGVFALKKFHKGSFLLSFKGKIYGEKDNPRGLNAKKNHYLQIGPKKFLGPSRSADDYVNHSCDPNAGIRIERGKINLYAIKGIGAGEEITFDYSTTMIDDEWTMGCRCKSKSCRGVIKEFKHLPPGKRQKYLRHGIVPAYVIKHI